MAFTPELVELASSNHNLKKGQPSTTVRENECQLLTVPTANPIEAQAQD